MPHAHPPAAPETAPAASRPPTRWLDVLRGATAGGEQSMAQAMARLARMAADTHRAQAARINASSQERDEPRPQDEFSLSGWVGSDGPPDPDSTVVAAISGGESGPAHKEVGR